MSRANRASIANEWITSGVKDPPASICAVVGDVRYTAQAPRRDARTEDIKMGILAIISVRALDVVFFRERREKRVL